MGIKEAYDAVLENENWKSKVFVCGLLILAYSISSGLSKYFQSKGFLFSLLALVLYSFFSFVVTGYFTQTIRNSLRNTTDFIPELKTHFSRYIFIGFKYTMAVTCIFILMLTAFIPLFFGKELLPLSAVIYIVFLFTFLIITPAINIYFATNYKFKSVFNFKQAIEIIKMSKGSYAKFLLNLFLLYVLNIIIIIMLAVTIVGIIAIPFVAAFVMFAAAYLHGQLYQEAIENLKSEAN